MLIRAHTFVPADFVGGHLVLDFVNTVTARDAEPVDWLDSYARLLAWAALTGDVAPDVLRALAAADAASPDGGAVALERTRALREGIWQVLTALLRREVPEPRALGTLEREWHDAVTHAAVAAADGRLQIRLRVETSGLCYLAHALALRAVEFLRALPVERTRVCAGRRCGWVFLDTSKGGRRRWCDMATCGNAAKSRRHHHRHHHARVENGEPPR